MRHSYPPPLPSHEPQPRVLAAPPAAMAAWLWSRSDMLQPTWDVVQAVAHLPGVVTSPDRGGLRLTLEGGAELGRLRWDGRISLAFAPEVRDRLAAEQTASLDPDQPDAHLIGFTVRTAADVPRATWLLRLAYLYADDRAVARARG